MSHLKLKLLFVIPALSRNPGRFILDSCFHQNDTYCFLNTDKQNEAR